MTHRISDHFKKVLDDTGLPWEIVQGTKHKKLYLAGRYIGTIPIGRKSSLGRATRNVEAQIRRLAKEVTP
jgi:hypothetical protein